MTTSFRGLPAAPGIGIGSLVIYRTGEEAADLPPLAPVPGGEIDASHEWQRFLSAQALVHAELEVLGRSLNPVAVDIFAVHQLILNDRTLIDHVFIQIHDQGRSAAAATHSAVQKMATQFRGMEDEYFASRATDILDVGRRLLTHLGAHAGSGLLLRLPPQTLLVAKDLTPSDVAQLSTATVVGIALAHSTPTAHSAILARSLGLPLVCALGEAICALERGTTAVIDGDSGLLLVEPDATALQRYGDVRRSLLLLQSTAAERAGEAAVTRDGVHVPVHANVNSAEEIAQLRRYGADGVGLLRTEYLFASHTTPPTQAEQAAVLGELADLLAGRLMTVRALDIGGDKPVGYMLVAGEENPFLGMRGIRLLLKHPQLLRDQFGALLSVARRPVSGAVLRYMLPMISTVQEVEAVRSLLRTLDEMEEAAAERDGVRPAIELGVLIEVPSAALMADRLAPLVGFFSIGTNDLAQYVLASDRTNSSVAALADPLHPAVLELVARTCQAAHAAHIPVSLCGEIAGYGPAVPLLLGLGVSELSVALPAVPLIKQVIRKCDLPACRSLAEKALACNAGSEVRALLAQGER